MPIPSTASTADAPELQLLKEQDRIIAVGKHVRDGPAIYGVELDVNAVGAGNGLKFVRESGWWARTRL